MATIQVGAVIFPTKAALTDHVRRIMGAYPDGAMLDDLDFAFMRTLLDLHPAAAAKVGAGVAGMWVAENPRFPGPKARCFYLRRLDGTETDFSFLECISPKPHRRKVFAAMRAGVEDQTRAFKSALLSDGTVRRCPDTGDVLTFDTAHVDHVAPLTFERLALDFLDGYGVAVDDVRLSGHGEDNRFDLALGDPRMLDHWTAYHACNANLALVSARANLSIRRVTP